jgi:hypothetical protein
MRGGRLNWQVKDCLRDLGTQLAQRWPTPSTGWSAAAGSNAAAIPPTAAAL